MREVVVAVGLPIGLLLVAYGAILLLAGCAFNPPYLRTIAPQAMTVVSAQGADVTYQCTMHVIGGLEQVARISSEPQSRLVSFQWHNAADMVIQVEPHTPGSLVNIRGSVPQNKVTTGEFDEVQVLGKRVQERCA